MRKENAAARAHDRIMSMDQTIHRYERSAENMMNTRRAWVLLINQAERLPPPSLGCFWADTRQDPETIHGGVF